MSQPPDPESLAARPIPLDATAHAVALGRLVGDYLAHPPETLPDPENWSFLMAGALGHCLAALLHETVPEPERAALIQEMRWIISRPPQRAAEQTRRFQ